MFVVHFRSSGISESLLTVNIHVSTKTCVTGNNFILHQALVPHTDTHVSAVTRNLTPTSCKTVMIMMRQTSLRAQEEVSH